MSHISVRSQNKLKWCDHSRLSLVPSKNHEEQLVLGRLQINLIDRDFFFYSAQAGIVRADKPRWKQTPIRQIFTSIPFISLVICHYGNLFLLFFYQNSLMLYLTKALGFRLTQGGAAAGAPWAARMLFGFFFSWAGDTIKRRQIISIGLLRKLATIFCKYITKYSLKTAIVNFFL